MIHTNFLISGLPRSGTTFLARVMNMSKQWTVDHDVHIGLLYKLNKFKGYSDEDVIRTIDEKIAKDYYGAIGGALRMLLLRFDASKKGIILRNPIDAMISSINLNARVGGRSRSPGAYIKRFRSSITLSYDRRQAARAGQLLRPAEILDRAATGSKVILFHKMTTDKDYLDEILRYFDITDVEITDKIMNRKINGPRRKRIVKLSDIPEDLQQKWKDEYQWLIDKWELPSRYDGN